MQYKAGLYEVYWENRTSSDKKTTQVAVPHDYDDYDEFLVALTSSLHNYDKLHESTHEQFVLITPLVAIPEYIRTIPYNQPQRINMAISEGYTIKHYTNKLCILENIALIPVRTINS